ncbi:MAG: fasciclin domain-containing protein [Planctomycetota bacterium]
MSFTYAARVLCAVAALCTTTALSSAQTITDIVASSGEFDNDRRDYDILLDFVLAAGLAETLADENANFTVFAPNDGAFLKLAADFGVVTNDEQVAAEAIKSVLATLDENGDFVPPLTLVLTYHVVPQRVNFFGFIVLSFFQVNVETVQGGTFLPRYFKIVDNDPDFRNPRLTFPVNVHADNGIIHTVNRVLIPIDLP